MIDPGAGGGHELTRMNHPGTVHNETVAAR
jgi:hypothetical protein